jgi:hypothetical protein
MGLTAVPLASEEDEVLDDEPRAEESVWFIEISYSRLFTLTS